jgi:hypothetical protein
MELLENRRACFCILIVLLFFNFRYLEGLQKCIGLTAENGRHSPEQVEKLIALYESLQQEYPSSAAVRV